MLLQGLSGVAFQTFKHWARDSTWLQNDEGGHELLAAMDLPENFGDDREEDLLSSLAKITYHIRREKNEEHRIFFNRWEEAMRRVNSHKVELPDPYKGFLLINALNLSEQDIKNMMNFTRGSISTKDVKDWVRKHETKLMAKEVGIELNKNKGKTASSSSAMHLCTTSWPMSTPTTSMRMRSSRPPSRSSGTRGKRMDQREKAKVKKMRRWTNMKFERC